MQKLIILRRSEETNELFALEQTDKYINMCHFTTSCEFDVLIPGSRLYNAEVIDETSNPLRAAAKVFKTSEDQLRTILFNMMDDQYCLENAKDILGISPIEVSQLLLAFFGEAESGDIGGSGPSLSSLQPEASVL
jgi:hypothetical protein